MQPPLTLMLPLPLLTLPHALGNDDQWIFIPGLD
jgi:hypothetical protein